MTGVPHPLDLNSASMDELTAVPGVGRSTAGDIVVDRPYESVAEVGAADADLERFATVSSPEGAD